MMKTFKISTLGCKVNQYESQALREQLMAVGMLECPSRRKVDLQVINSCAVTQRAQNRSFEQIRRAKNDNPACRVVFTGCCVKAAREGSYRGNTADLWLDNQEKHRLAHWLERKQKYSGKGNGEITPLQISGFSGHSRAFVKVQDGCDNFCSYCTIPLLRGASRSRERTGIIPEVKQLVGRGFKEIVLTGICLGDYGKELRTRDRRRFLVDLITDLEKIKATFRIRLSSIEAKDVTDRLIDKLAQSKRLCPHLHIPFQSGDDEMLKKMHRGYSAKDYLNTVEKLRRVLPDIAVSTDIMTGFPSEEERHFQNTRKFLRAVKPMRVHVFPFSPRPGTAAWDMPGWVLERVVKEREGILLEEAKQLALAYHRKFLGKTLEVLAEDREDKAGGWLQGYSGNYIPVRFRKKEDFKGNLIKVKVSQCSSQSVSGRVISCF